MHLHLHAEGAPQLRHGLAQRAVAEQTQAAAGQVADRVAEQAEALGGLPQARFHVGPVGDQLAAQGQHQGQRMLRHGGARIVADIRHHDAPLAAGGQVEDIRAGGGHGDHF